MAVTPRIVATQGVQDGPQQTAAQGLLALEVDIGLSTTLLVSPSLTATLTVGDEKAGGGKRKKQRKAPEPQTIEQQLRQLNPLIRVEFERVTPTKEHAQFAKTSPLAGEFVPVTPAKEHAAPVRERVTPVKEHALPIAGMGLGQHKTVAKSLPLKEHEDDDTLLVAALLELID